MVHSSFYLLLRFADSFQLIKALIEKVFQEGDLLGLLFHEVFKLTIVYNHLVKVAAKVVYRGSGVLSLLRFKLEVAQGRLYFQLRDCRIVRLFKYWLIDLPAKFMEGLLAHAINL